MSIILSILCFLCSVLWYGLLESLLHGVAIETISLKNPMLTHGMMVCSFLAVMFIQHLLFLVVERYRYAMLSSVSKNYARMAVFLGLNLGVLLRCIMLMRMEISQKTVYTSDVTYPLDSCSFFWWAFGGGLSGAAISFAILIALSLMQGEENEHE